MEPKLSKATKHDTVGHTRGRAGNALIWCSPITGKICLIQSDFQLGALYMRLYTIRAINYQNENHRVDGELNLLLSIYRYSNIWYVLVLAIRVPSDY